MPTQFTIAPKKWANEGDLLFCVRGSTTGRMNWADQRYAIGRGIAAIRHRSDKTLNPLIRGVIEWQLPDLLTAATGSTFPNISGSQLANLPWPKAIIGSEKAIANVLTALDKKIELNRQMNATLEGMAQVIFRDWFVNFGPVRRKLAGITDPVAILGGLIPTPAKADPLAALFADTLGDDGLPVGWEMAPLEETLVLQRGFDLPKTSRTDGAFPVIAASGSSGTHNEYKVRGPGVCTGRSGVLGNVYFVDEDFWPLNTALWVKSFPNSTALYAYHILREIDLGAFNAGSAVPTLNRNHVHGLPLTKPPMPIVRAFDEIGMLCYGRMKANEAESRTLAETRDYLLPRLMSGKVRVREIEGIVA